MTTSSIHHTSIDLLRIRAYGAVGSASRLRGARFLLAGEVEAFDVGGAVSSSVAAALRSAKASAPAWRDPTASPPALEPCRRAFEAQGHRVRVGSTSLTYLIEPSVAYSAAVESVRSDRALLPWVRDANPGNWEPDEWDDLLEGREGPWAMSAVDRRITSICHTPLPMTDDYAECGVWTDPEFRRRGYAAATTAAWAQVVGGTGRHLFYTTVQSNRSSQRVTERLGLRFVGYEVGLDVVEEGNE